MSEGAPLVYSLRVRDELDVVLLFASSRVLIKEDPKYLKYCFAV